MNKIMIVPVSEELLSSKKSQSSKRGAMVYGMPLAKEIASYIDDVAPHAAQQRLVDMFFAGRTPMPFGVDTEFDEIDETIEEGF